MSVYGGRKQTVAVYEDRHPNSRNVGKVIEAI